MQATLIPLENVFLGLLPLVFVFVVFYLWQMNWKKYLLASSRMLIQLMVVGYFLTFIFSHQKLYISVPLVLIMMSLSAWIALHSVAPFRVRLYKYAFVALILGALPNLMLTTMVVIPHSPWYDPAFLIPLSGMVFTQSMNTIGIASERFLNEIKIHDPHQAAALALQACLIPILNSYMAVGLVSLPGMMTGQILSGVEPLIAARYQILIMTMMMGAGSMTAFFFLVLLKKDQVNLHSVG
ncbi:MAG: hypothetical protein CME62_06945 [Halobacteriovoraceae bacterium]|nr:hypothetical protein [Halobacteriovoraceae bacterium]|tara:strand:+ start:9027 stop:9743 length:717 start_codon:yes stop_codon:yes gene_type:complete